MHMTKLRHTHSRQSSVAQDGTDSLVTAYQQAVVSANNVILNGPLGADAIITTTGGVQVICEMSPHAGAK